MMMLVNCSRCQTPLQLPPGARSIRCAICQAITHIAEARDAPAPPSHGYGSAPAPPPPAAHFPSPYGPPGGPPPSPHGRKKAVICGISYRNSRHELKGCINDAKCMKYLLINRFHFPEASIIMLTEEERDPHKIPTKHNIRMALFWLVQGCQPGDSLLFHYSGHGSQQRNYSGEEVDGYDETICPLDFETQGMIVDDEINAAIVRPLPRGVRLHAIIDACHSGTVLDLPFLCRMNRSGKCLRVDNMYGKIIVHDLVYGKGPMEGKPYLLVGVMMTKLLQIHRRQANALSRVTSTGAMTFCFIQAIERGQGTTYGSILNSMRSTIRNTGEAMGGGAVTSLITMLLTGGSGGGGLRQIKDHGKMTHFLMNASLAALPSSGTRHSDV
ncbi:hypothetical protein Taro_007561 [Colocasia esculenta]|uniref:Uncharacterized protein n=1 Tax=Colocasia esculenta TaxID=4460 RepID=A0A843U0S3_COLES|nr:hypothetical protein [Colocasia esculenta]